MRHLSKFHYKLKTHVIFKSFLWDFCGFYHQLVVTSDILKSNRNTEIIFRKCNHTHNMHESVLKQDKKFCGYLLALIRPFK